MDGGSSGYVGFRGRILCGYIAEYRSLQRRVCPYPSSEYRTEKNVLSFALTSQKALLD